MDDTQAETSVTLARMETAQTEMMAALQQVLAMAQQVRASPTLSYSFDALTSRTRWRQWPDDEGEPRSKD